MEGKIMLPYVMNNFSGNLAKVFFKKRKGNKTKYIVTYRNSQFINGLKETTIILNDN